MIRTLTKNWWLLALCGVLDAAISVVYFVMQATDGPLTFHAWRATVALLGKLAIAAGACAIAAGIWTSIKDKAWPLLLNGLALCALGVIYYGFVRFRISLLTIALLVIAMALSLGLLEFVIARSLRAHRHVADTWLLNFAAAVSVGFALAFLALGLRWIKIEPGSYLDLLWFGAYFGFSAICKLGLALRLHSLGSSQSGQWEPLPPLRNPKHAH